MEHQGVETGGGEGSIGTPHDRAQVLAVQRVEGVLRQRLVHGFPVFCPPKYAPDAIAATRCLTRIAVRPRLKGFMLRESDMKLGANTLKSAAASGRRLRSNWFAYTFYHLKILGYR